MAAATQGSIPPNQELDQQNAYRLDKKKDPSTRGV
jgi:hypothetical protein